MFAYRGLFLVAAISSAGVALAEVLVQPGYQYHGSEHHPQHQTIPNEHQALSPEQHYTKQLTNQPHATGIHTTYPYQGVYEQQARSQLLQYPHHYYHSLPRHLHIAKIGGHDYTHPSVYIGYHPSSIVHYRHRRSSGSDPTVDETGAHAKNNVVATESTLMNIMHPTVIGSYLTDNQPIDTNDKHAKNRPSKDVHTANGPLLLGLYPDGMRQVSSMYPPQTSLLAREHSNEQSTVDSVKTVLNEPTQQTIPTSSQDKIGGQEVPYINLKDLPHPHKIIIQNFNEPSNPISVPSNKESAKIPIAQTAFHVVHHNNDYHSNSEKTGVQPISSPPLLEPFHSSSSEPRNFPDPRQIPIHSAYSTKPASTHLQDAHRSSDKEFLQMAYGGNGDQRIEELTSAPNSDETASTFRTRPRILDLPDHAFFPIKFEDYTDYPYDPYDPYSPYDPSDPFDPYFFPYPPRRRYLMPDPYLGMDPYPTIDPYPYPIARAHATDLDYPIYKYGNSGARSNPQLITDTVQTSPCVPWVQQLASADNWPEEARYYALP